MTTISSPLILGRLYQSDARGFAFTCGKTNVLVPQIGDMVCAAVGGNGIIYGIITNISWQSDDLIYQLARTETNLLSPGIIEDNQSQRSAGPSISVLILGYYDGQRIIHTLPPRPPLSLEQIWLASDMELRDFTGHSLAYLRLILEAGDLIPITDILAVHMRITNQAHIAAGNKTWLTAVIDHLIDILADNFDRLVSLFEAVAQQIPDRPEMKKQG